MSEEFVNNWRPRKEQLMRFESGNACILQNPGPELALKTSHLNRRLAALRKVSSNALPEEMTDEEREAAELDALERMTDEERRVSYEIMCVTVAACVKRPRIYVNPQPGQVGVSDIDPAEFLKVWTWWRDGCPDIPEDEGVTTAEADSFLTEQTPGSGTGDSSGDVRTETERVDEAA